MNSEQLENGAENLGEEAKGSEHGGKQNGETHQQNQRKSNEVGSNWQARFLIYLTKPPTVVASLKGKQLCWGPEYPTGSQSIPAKS